MTAINPPAIAPAAAPTTAPIAFPIPGTTVPAAAPTPAPAATIPPIPIFLFIDPRPILDNLNPPASCAACDVFPSCFVDS